MKENEWAVSPDNFFNQAPNKYFIKALEETTVGYLSHSCIQQLYENFPELRIIENYFVRNNFIRTLSYNRILRHKAGERLSLFQESYFDLFIRVPKKYIASFLGVAQETLSRRRTKR